MSIHWRWSILFVFCLHIIGKNRPKGTDITMGRRLCESNLTLIRGTESRKHSQGNLKENTYVSFGLREQCGLDKQSLSIRYV